jgi:site-specific DNA recombinase
MRVTDAISRRARAGYCCGGSCFESDNVVVFDGSGRRSHVERRVNESEAAIVRRIFELCAGGAGYTRIAKLLNGEQAPAPHPKQGRPTGWAPSSIKEILDRRTYLGEFIWNRTRKCDTWGQKRQSARPETDWIQASMPALRIISNEQWAAAHARLEGVRSKLIQASGSRIGVRRRDVESHYLLSGFARCAHCGGSLGVMSGSHSSARGHLYGCLAYLKRGTSVCGNALRLPLDRVDDAVFSTLIGDVLRPQIVMAVIDGVLEEMTPRSRSRDLLENEAALRTVEQGISNLAQAIAAAGELGPLLHELQVARAKRDELTDLIGALRCVDVRQLDRSKIEMRVHEHLNAWRKLLSTKQVQDGRRVLREMLMGPLRFTPEGRTYRFEGEATFGGPLAGMAGAAPFLVAVRGIEPRFDG